MDTAVFGESNPVTILGPHTQLVTVLSWVGFNLKCAYTVYAHLQVLQVIKEEMVKRKLGLEHRH